MENSKHPEDGAISWEVSANLEKAAADLAEAEVLRERLLDINADIERVLAQTAECEAAIAKIPKIDDNIKLSSLGEALENLKLLSAKLFVGIKKFSTIGMIGLSLAAGAQVSSESIRASTEAFEQRSRIGVPSLINWTKAVAKGDTYVFFTDGGSWELTPGDGFQSGEIARALQIMGEEFGALGARIASESNITDMEVRAIQTEDLSRLAPGEASKLEQIAAAKVLPAVEKLTPEAEEMFDEWEDRYADRLEPLFRAELMRNTIMQSYSIDNNPAKTQHLINEYIGYLNEVGVKAEWHSVQATR